jgi:chemotaxis protein MotB
MALRGRRDSSMIWPGFVDAVTTLLMVLMFVLTIFTVMQSVLRETITTQDGELNELTAQVAQLADALGLERVRADELQTEVGSLRSSLTQALATGEAQAAEIVGLTGALAAREGELADARGQIASFEAQVATLLAERDTARGEASALTASVADLEAAQRRLISEQEALQLALATARSEIDAGTEAARLAAARREALEGLIADLRRRAAETSEDLADVQGQLAAVETELSAEEAARLADQAALLALQEKLAASDTELTAMTLVLEEQRKRAEETLTLLAAAQTEAAQNAVAGDQQAALLATAEAALTAEQDRALAAQRDMALLNEQIAALRAELGTLQGLLDASAAKDAEAQVQVEALGSQLNAALAQVAAEQRRRADLEEAERIRLEAEAQDLARYRSEFFAQLSELLAGREGVRVVGDRFVFSSEVLFTAGSATLAPEGRVQIASVVATLNDVATQIPPQIDWIIRVDGHTDNVPLSGFGEFADNWELSQARALSVVRFMQDELGFAPNRMAATGFGEYRPVAAGDAPAALAANRRIELKLTER